MRDTINYLGDEQEHSEGTHKKKRDKEGHNSVQESQGVRGAQAALQQQRQAPAEEAQAARGGAEEELESLQQANKLLTDQIRTLQVALSLLACKPCSPSPRPRGITSLLCLHKLPSLLTLIARSLGSHLRVQGPKHIPTNHLRKGLLGVSTYK